VANTKKLDKLLAKAEKAYQKRDKRRGAQYVDEVLKKDFNYPGAWELLYRRYGQGQTLEGFRLSFTRKFYPDRLALLRAAGAPEPSTDLAVAYPAESAQKPSFFARLFRRSSARPKEARPAWEEIATQPVRQPPPSLSASSAEKPGASSPAGEAQGRKFVPVSLLPETKSQSIQPAAPPRSQPAQAVAPPRSQPSPSVAPPRSQPAQPVSPPVEKPPVPPPTPILRPPDSAPGEGPKIRVVVVDDIAQTRETIVRTLQFQESIDVVGTATNGVQAIALVKQVQPDVVIMDVNMPDMDGITATAKIRGEVPFTQVIILTVQDDIDYMRQAMLAGARDFLSKPPMIDELVAAVTRASDYARQEKQKAPPRLAVHAAVEAPKKGKIITVYSAKGGAGCTMLATNLAAALYKEETPVAVVDGNLQYGDLLVLFNVISKLSVIDLAPRADELDKELVEEVMVQHESGIKLLAAPRPELSEDITGQQFAKVLSYISDLFAYVIVDTSNKLSDPTLAALDASDLIILVTTQDIPSIARTRKFLDLVPMLKIDPQRILVVMNQFDKRVGIVPERVSQTFHIDIDSLLPLERSVVVPSVNRGVPFMLERDKLSHPISRAILEVAQAARKKLAQQGQAAVAETS
jgi:pilus assembly protein CpaE